MWVYNGLHSAPAIVWSVLMPLQHSGRFRGRWPAFHRASGYLILSLSLLLSMTGYWFFFSKNAYSHPNVFHRHNFRPAIPIDWPTFELSTYFLAPFYWATMYKTAVSARGKDFASHRKWAVLHTIFASVISLQRLSVTILYVAGYILTYLPEEKVYDFLQVSRTTDSIAEAELSLFAFSNIMAVVLLLIWVLYELGQAGYLASVWHDSPLKRSSMRTDLKTRKLQ